MAKLRMIITSVSRECVWCTYDICICVICLKCPAVTIRLCKLVLMLLFIGFHSLADSRVFTLVKFDLL